MVSITMFTAIKHRFFVVLGTALILAFAPMVQAGNEGYIQVSGVATVSVIPDYIQIAMTVESNKPSAAEAARQNAQQMADLLNFALAQGISEKDLTTQRLSLNPQYQYTDRAPELVGYKASRSLLIKVRALYTIDALAVMLAERGGQQINGFRTGLDDPQQYTQSLLIDALANAKAKASALALSQAYRLHGLIDVREESDNNDRSPVEFRERGLQQAAVVAPSTQAGLINLQASVVAKFALRAAP